MKEQDNIELIRHLFSEMEIKEDLVALLNTAKALLYEDSKYPVQLRQINYYANPKTCGLRYEEFQIKKKSGGSRTIHAPHKGLKTLLRLLNYVLTCVAEPHRAATGFVPGKSIVDNAKVHVGQQYVYNIDLKDFFHSFDRNKVKLGLMRSPLGLSKERESLAFLLASLCTHPLEIDGETLIVLPQGSPCSPTLTNILCVNLDRRLNGLAKRYKAKYTRYADDITFSCFKNIFKDEEFLAELKRIIEEDQGFEINPNKTRLQGMAYKQEVTGLKVNEKVNVNTRYIKQLRMWLSYWEKYGDLKAETIFKRDYLKDKKQIQENEIPAFKHVLDGKINYLKMVKGAEDGTYLKLKMRFDALSGVNRAFEELLDVWEEKGIDEAMVYYNQL